MAEKELDVSWSATFIDAADKIDWNSTKMVEGLKGSLTLWDAINAKAEEYQSSTVESSDIIKKMLEDEIAQNRKKFEQELKYQVQIQKIEQEIASLGDKATKKQLEQLEKRKKIIQQTQDIEKKTQAIVNKYQDDMDAREALRKAQKEAQESGKKLIADGWKSGNWAEMKDGAKLALSGGLDGKAGVLKALDTMTSKLSDLVKKLDGTIQEIASYKSDWDTRLFGSGKSHWTLTTAIQFALGASPYAKQSEVFKNLDKAVESGIAYNIEQRAFLETIKDDIAGTFDAFDSTLLQIIRVQQSDSTAARMGMEAALNEYLNKTFKTTEYLSNVSDSVTQALYEATSLLTSNQSVGFEYQVQKWLGSLYSVGMSNTGVTSIANALGQLASGDVSGTTSGAGKLLVMSASRAGLSYSDLLTKGINESQINSLMENMVEYLKTIADSNKVVQTELARVYGLQTSDIVAASNLTGVDVTNIYSNSLDYGGGINALNKMARTIGLRMSTGEMMTNVIDNFKSTLATGIANNPLLYAMWTISNMLDQLVGGIPIPTIGAWAMGTGTEIDLETTVADLMRVGALGGGLLSGIGSLVSGLGTNALGLQGVLAALGVRNTASTVTRGGGLSSGLSQTTSQVSYIGNTSGNDVYDSSMASADDQKNELAVQAKEDQDSADEDIKLADLNNTAIQIYELLESVIHGGRLTIAYDNSVNGFFPD